MKKTAQLLVVAQLGSFGMLLKMRRRYMVEKMGQNVKQSEEQVFETALGSAGEPLVSP